MKFQLKQRISSLCELYMTFVKFFCELNNPPYYETLDLQVLDLLKHFLKFAALLLLHIGEG